MLHRVLAGPPADHYYFRRGTAISRDKFLELLAAIAQRGLPIVTEPVGAGDKSVCLTFDDAYADVAWPLEELRERGASAWLFPVMNYVQTGFSVMDDLAAWIVRRPELRELEGHARVRALLRRMRVERYRRLRERMLGLSDDRCDPALFLGEHELRRLAALGIRLGVHGVSHRIWPSLGQRLHDQEIEPALRWLRGMGEDAPETFCFPHGKAPKAAAMRELLSRGRCFGVDCAYEEPGVIRRVWFRESTDIGILLDDYLAA